MAIIVIDNKNTIEFGRSVLMLVLMPIIENKIDTKLLIVVEDLFTVNLVDVIINAHARLNYMALWFYMALWVYAHKFMMIMLFGVNTCKCTC